MKFQSAHPKPPIERGKSESESLASKRSTCAAFNILASPMRETGSERVYACVWEPILVRPVRIESWTSELFLKFSSKILLLSNFAPGAHQQVTIKLEAKVSINTASHP